MWSATAQYSDFVLSQSTMVNFKDMDKNPPQTLLNYVFEHYYYGVRWNKNYEMLGTLLLNDNTGAKTAAIIEECRENASRINRKILRQWIQGQGRQPVT